MEKILLVGVLGYAVPRIAWLLICRTDKPKLRTIAYPLTVLYAITIIGMLIWPNILHAIAFTFLTIIAVLDEILGWMHFFRKRIKQARKEVHLAAKEDGSWDEASIIQESKEIINHYRIDWMERDFVAISRYATDRFSYHNRLFFEALNNLNRTVSQKAEIIDLQVMNAHDSPDDEQDRFSLYITSDSSLELHDHTTNNVLLANEGETEEIYEIEREDHEWKLDSALIAKEGGAVAYHEFQQFAHKHGYYYNNRSSYLLLPYDNSLSMNHFKDQGHIILGVHRNLLFTIFQFKAPSSNVYSVATTTLPGEYPHILIRNRSVDDLDTNKLHRVETDWPAFNENYDLFVDEPNSEKILLKFLTSDLVKYMLSLPGEASVEIIRRRVYIVFPSNDELLISSPSILAQLHRRSLLAIPTE